MPVHNGRFVSLVDMMLLAKVEELEEQLVKGIISINDVRVKFCEMRNQANDPKIKEYILMEYDGLEIGATKQVT